MKQLPSSSTNPSPTLSNYTQNTVSVSSFTPNTKISRVNQRIANSPLQIPLALAIQNIAKSSKGRSKSNRVQQNYKRFKLQDLKDTHRETKSFISKYLSEVEIVSCQTLAKFIFCQYEQLWKKHNSLQIQRILQDKTKQVFKGECIRVDDLIIKTQEHGMLEFILKLFDCHSEDMQDKSQMKNFKNIIQQFAQSLMTSLENEIYTKFNAEMNRIALKYRQAESLLQKIERNITLNADILQMQKIMRKKRAEYLSNLEALQVSIKQMDVNIQSHKLEKEFLVKENLRLKDENIRLIGTNKTYEKILLKKLGETNTFDNYDEENLKANTHRQYCRKHNCNEIGQTNTDSSSDLKLNQSILSNINQLFPSHSPIKQQVLTYQSCRPSFECSKNIEFGKRNNENKNLETKRQRFY